jgi:hypothetical protein
MRAGLETVLVATGLVLLSCIHRQQILLFGPFTLPLLSIFRARLALESEDRFTKSEVTAAEMAEDFHRHASKAARRNRLESMAFALAALLGALVCWQIHFPLQLRSAAGIYGAAAAYLLLTGRNETLPAEFTSMRAHYEQALAHQDQLRSFMWWLWLTPFIFAIQSGLIGSGIAADDTRAGSWGLGIAACFMIGAINSERSGRVREIIAGLSRIREAKTA